jgi:phage shock protein PspC (stress-responsive transcriptional regulator)
MEHPIQRRPFSEWHRGGAERRIAGVCAALARELNAPLPAVRAAFVLAVALPGIRILAAGLYLALWFVIPPTPGEPSALDRAIVAFEDWFRPREDRPNEEQ